MATRSEDLEVGVNLSVVCGPCSGAPEVRVLESGTRLATIGVRCPGVGRSGAGAAARDAYPAECGARQPNRHGPHNEVRDA